MDGELERLLIRLEADTTQLRRELATADTTVAGFASNVDSRLVRSGGSFKTFSNSAISGLKSLAAAFGVTYVAMKAFDALETAGGINDLARAAALSTDGFQELAFAANQAGMSQDNFSAAMKRLSINMAGVRTNAGPLNDFLKDQLPLVDAQLKQTTSQQEALNVLADVMKRLNTEEAKTTLAQQAFGKSGTDMVEVLQKGSSGLAEMADKAHALGIVQSGELLDSAEQLKKKYAELGAASEAAWERAAVAVASYGQKVQENLKNSPLSATPLGMFADALGVKPGAGGSNSVTDPALGPAVDLSASNKDVLELGDSLKDIKEQWEKVNTAAKEALNTMTSDATIDFATKFGKINSAVETGKITFQQWGDLSKKVSKDQVGQAEQTATAVSSSIDTIFQNNKGAAIASALINTSVGVTKAFAELAPPFSFITAAAITAAGLAQVASIRSTSKDGGGSAPSVSAPVSSGGGDDGSGGGGGSSGGPARSIHVSLNGRTFDREQVRDLIEGLNDAIRDGAVLHVG